MTEMRRALGHIRVLAKACLLLGGIVASGAIAIPGGAQQTHMLIISGLAGEPQYARSFKETAAALADAA